MAITRKQQQGMAAILIAGGLLAVALLWSGRHPDGDHADEQAHGHAPSEQGPRDGNRPPAPAPRPERRVHLTPEQIRQAGIEMQVAGPGTLQLATPFPGEIKLNDDRTAHVVPRLAGVAEQVPALLGQSVRKGDVLAVIASTTLSDQRSEWLTAQRRLEAARLSFDREKKLWDEKISAEQDFQQAQTALQEAEIALRNARQKLAAVGAVVSSKGLNRFELRAPFDGSIVQKHLSLGEAVAADASIFTISDMRTVWAEFNVSAKDLESVQVGQRVLISSTASDSQAQGTVSYVGALLGEQTRTARARVTLQNPKGAWRPGLYVTVAVLGNSLPVPLALREDAVQSLGEQRVVFKAVADGFEATPVQVGRSDGRMLEVLSGVKAGERIVSANAFVLKSELGKADAGHEH